MISPLRLFEIYSAINLHFKPGNYDFFKYSGKTRVNENTLLKFKGRYAIDSMSRNLHSEDKAIEYVSASYIFGNVKWIKDINQDNFKKYIGYKESLNYLFREQCIKYKDCSHIIEIAKVNRDHLIWLTVLDIVTNGSTLKILGQTLQDNPIWEEAIQKIEKIKPFIRCYFSINKTLLVDIIKEINQQ